MHANTVTLDQAFFAGDEDPNAELSLLMEEELLAIHGGSSDTIYIGGGGFPPGAPGMTQPGSEGIGQQLQDAAIYGLRHAAAETIDFVKDPIDYVLTQVSDWIRPDDLPPSLKH
jgi:hypothetical protein